MVDHVDALDADVSGTSSAPISGSVWAVFLGLGLLMVGNGLNGAIIGVRSTTEGFSATVTGIVMAGYFGGFLLAPSLIVKAIASVGHIRVFAGLASTASSAVLVHAVSVLPITWVSMRFVFGFCVAGLYIVIESWLSDLSGESGRSRMLAMYMVVSMSGLGIGQYLIALADPNGFRLFVLSSVLVSMSLVPITLAGTTQAPQIRLPEPVSIRELVQLVPTGVVGSFMTGTGAGVVIGLGAVYATGVGLPLERTAAFLLAPTLGGVLMQFPIAQLSRRIRRRILIFGVALAAVGLCVTATVLAPESNLVLLVMFGIGGTLFPLYSLVVGYTLDWVGAERAVGASGSLIRVNGTGALVGPIVTAPLISAFGADSFYWVLTGAFATVAGFISYRILFKEAVPQEREAAYVPFPARAGALAIQAVVKPVRDATRIAAGRHVTSRRHPHARPTPPDDPGT